ncbi:asparagine synthase-related protein [Mycoplasmatota bacterium zrk1]
MRNYIGEFIFKKAQLSDFNYKIRHDKLRVAINSDVADIRYELFDSEQEFLLLDGELFTGESVITSLDYIRKILSNVIDGKYEDLSKLNGSFNIFFYRIQKDELYIITDRFRTRPLYYYQNSSSIIFSNEIRNIRPKNFVTTIDKNSVIEFFRFQRIFGNKTFVKGINTFKYATMIKFSNSQVSEYKYWTYRHNEDYDLSFGTHLDKISRIVVDIVNEKTSDGLNYGLLLSGGLDSRCVLAGDLENKIQNVYSIGDFENNECLIAQEVSSKLNRNYQFIQREKGYYKQIVNKSISIGSGMYNYLHSHYLKYIINKIQRENDVIFNGSLIEQLWQGTKFIHKSFSILGNQIKLPIIEKKSYTEVFETIYNNYPHRLNHVEELFNEVNADDLKRICIDGIKSQLSENFGDDVYSQQEAIDFLACDSFGRYSSHLNQLCLNYNIRYRTILDNNLVDELLKIPIKYRFNGRFLRKLIIHLNKELGNIKVASSNLKLKRSRFFHWVLALTISVKKKIQRNKQVYSPYSSWPNYSVMLIEDDVLQRMIYSNLQKLQEMSFKLFDYEMINNMLEKHIQGKKDNGILLFQFLTFSEWYINFVCDR